MVNHSPAGKMAAITGSSVHNNRVQQLNHDLNIHCADVIKLQLYEFEHQRLLNPSNDTDIFAYIVYIPGINQLLQELSAPVTNLFSKSAFWSSYFFQNHA